MKLTEQESKNLIDQLQINGTLSRNEFIALLSNRTPEVSEYLFAVARSIQQEFYQNHIYIRGLIEFTNYCRNDCYYCGIRASNQNAHRYRLNKETILACCKTGYQLGFRTFVLQGGEDPYFTDERMLDIIATIRSTYSDCAITLSIGEKSRETYQAFYEAGADRYLLRHETFSFDHYSQLHPSTLLASHRQQCLFDLKAIGYQVGTGIMVGSPYQTIEHIADDLLFIKKLSPQMIGIGPFIRHKDTPFADKTSGTLESTLFLIGILRLLIPRSLIPATTALGTIDPRGRELGILAGANVVMPNLSPADVRRDYLLYDDKLCSGEESAELLSLLKKQMNGIGYEIVSSRGDSKHITL